MCMLYELILYHMDTLMHVEMFPTSPLKWLTVLQRMFNGMASSIRLIYPCIEPLQQKYLNVLYSFCSFCQHNKLCVEEGMGWNVLTHNVLLPAPARLSQNHRSPPAAGCTWWHADLHVCLEHGRHAPDCTGHGSQEPAVAKKVTTFQLPLFPAFNSLQCLTNC